MTRISFETKDGHIVAVTAEGHTGFAESGEDIVCSALSSMVQTAVLGLMQVAKINVSYKVDEEKGGLSCVLPEGLNERSRHDADVILQTLLLGVSDLYEGFSDYIDLEVI